MKFRLPRAVMRWPAGFLLLAVMGAPVPALAHAFGQRYDLPLPLFYYIVGGGIAVLLSFIVMSVFVIRPNRDNDLHTQHLVSWPATNLAAQIVRSLIELVSVALLVFLLAAGFYGFQRNPNFNILPTTVWVLWWVGLAFASALFGNLWDAINPWSAIARWVTGLIGFLGLGRGTPLLAYPKWLSAWPALILFTGFAWMEVAWPSRIVPAKLAEVIVIYSAITWVGMALFGRRAWLANGEAFTLFFGTFAHFALFAGRIRDGRFEFVARPPAVGLLERLPVSAAHLAFILLIFSTVTFDGLAETSFWQSATDWIAMQDFLWPVLLQLSYLIGGTPGVNMTLGLAAVFTTFVTVYLVFAGLIAKSSGERRAFGEVAILFVYSLVPIAIAYHLAHFLSFLLIFGQSIIPLLSNPFGYGTDFFGTADYRINIGLIGPKFAWISAAIAIVTGHIAAVYVAHVMALRIFSSHRAALISQIPMLVLMVSYTMISLWILAQPIVE